MRNEPTFLKDLTEKFSQVLQSFYELLAYPCSWWLFNPV